MCWYIRLFLTLYFGIFVFIRRTWILQITWNAIIEKHWWRKLDSSRIRAQNREMTANKVVAVPVDVIGTDYSVCASKTEWMNLPPAPSRHPQFICIRMTIHVRAIHHRGFYAVVFYHHRAFLPPLPSRCIIACVFARQRGLIYIRGALYPTFADARFALWFHFPLCSLSPVSFIRSRGSSFATLHFAARKFEYATESMRVGSVKF